MLKNEIAVIYGYFLTKYKLGDGETDYLHLPYVSLSNALENGYIYVTENDEIKNRVAFRGFTKNDKELN